MRAERISLIIIVLFVLHISKTEARSTFTTNLKVSIETENIKYVKVGFYQNMLVELDPGNTVKKEVASNNIVNFEFVIERPEILFLLSSNSSIRYKIYAVPGDSIEVSIYNDRIEYNGDSSLENNFLKKYQLNLVNYQKPSFYEEHISIEYLSKLSKMTSKILKELAECSFTKDFESFINAECIGLEYFPVYNKLWRIASDTIAMDSLSQEKRAIVRWLFNIEKVDEVRSRSYINSLNGFMKLKMANELNNNQLNDYYIKLDKIRKIRQESLSFSPELLEIFLVGHSSSALYLAKDEDQLMYAEYLISDVKNKYGTSQSNAFKYIDVELKKKRNRFNLNIVSDHVFQTLESDSILISELFEEDKVVAIYVWATWCRPCIEFLKMLPSSENANIKFVVLNIWSEKEAWHSSLLKYDFIDKFNHLYSNKKMSETLKEDWSIDKLPFFILIDKDLNVHEFTSDKSRIKEILVK